MQIFGSKRSLVSMGTSMENKVALVTGGSSGVGRAASLAFANKGAKVVVVSRGAKAAEETVAIIKASGGVAHFVKADVSRAEEVRGMVDQALSLYQRLDYAFNNAGVFVGTHPLSEYSEEMWDKCINVNLKGIWLSMKYEIPAMLKNGGGAIVNCSSVSGLTGYPFHYGYTASKWGINGITKCAAMEFVKKGIRVNAVCPWIVDTKMSRDWGILKDGYQAPNGRFLKPEEVASAVVWLCSDEASYITGEALTIDGGLTCV